MRLITTQTFMDTWKKSNINENQNYVFKQKFIVFFFTAIELGFLNSKNVTKYEIETLLYVEMY